MRFFMVIFYLLLVLLGASFAALNAESVSLHLYFTSFKLPLALLLALMLGLGLILGMGLFLLRYWHLKLECLKVKKQLKLMEKEIKNLRAIPLSDEHAYYSKNTKI